jgi:hypothetical protein
MSATLLFVVVTFIDITAAIIIFCGALSERMRLYPAWHKIGLMVAVGGLAAQAFRNIQFLITGVSPSDASAPLWVLKDAGIAIIAYCYLYIGIKAHFAKPVAKPVRRRVKK